MEDGSKASLTWFPRACLALLRSLMDNGGTASPAQLPWAWPTLGVQSWKRDCSMHGLTQHGMTSIFEKKKHGSVEDSYPSLSPQGLLCPGKANNGIRWNSFPGLAGPVEACHRRVGTASLVL